MNQALRHLRIADLELFITTAHLKNLSKAALIHNLSQSAASASIMRVETAFGYSLCTHEKRQFRLTHEGAMLVPRAEEWLKQFRETVMTDSPRPIRLATTHAIARVVIPAILPISALDLQLMRPDSAYGSILRDEADIALVPDNAPWDGVLSVEVGFEKQEESRRLPQGWLSPPHRLYDNLAYSCAYEHYPWQEDHRALTNRHE